MKTTAVLIVVAGVCAAAGARPCEQHEKCVALTHCPSLRRLAEADKAALRAAQCGWAPGEAAMSTAPQVCCPLLPLDECALPNPDRLIFSTAVRVFEAPWLARLAYRSEQDSLEYGCSASLVTDLYLVTAAHCVVPRAPVSVRLGELDTETDPDCSNIPGGLLCAAPALDVAVDSVIAHPEYAASDARNDIALVRLRRAVGFTDDVRPVCLPVAGVVVTPPKGHRVLVVHGWGSQANNGSANRLMTKGQQLEVLVDACAARPLAARPFDAEVQLCTAPKHRSNACRGDLGGSLTAAYVRAGSDQGPVETLVGVLSFGGDACGNETAPTASTRVAAFMPWILAGLGDGGSVH